MPRIRYIGGYINFKRREEEKLKAEQQNNPQCDSFISPPIIEDKDSDDEQEMPIQTFPGAQQTIHVVRQTKDDLTCGLRCLQNMYGPSICDKDEMDQVASELQSRAHGIELYNPDLGYYAAEVLEAVLQQKGKWTQRIDIDKIDLGHFKSILKCNPTFSGYIVTLGLGLQNHYITIRAGAKHYKQIDSLPGVQPIQISEQDLFQKRSDGHLYCNPLDGNPIIALTAVGGSPFVEYNIMHSIWSNETKDIHTIKLAILNCLDYNKQQKQLQTKEEKDWYKSWQMCRKMPSQQVLSKIVSILRNELSLERDVIVHLENQQTIIRCTDLKSLIENLMTMNFIKDDQPFTFVQDQIVQYHSEMPNNDNIDWSKPIHIEPPKVPEIGGFYTFKSTVEGTCTEKQSGTYSVRDKDGIVHVLHKKAVSGIIVSK